MWVDTSRMYSARLRRIVDTVWWRIPAADRARMGTVVFHDSPDFPHPRGAMASAGLNDVWLDGLRLERQHIDTVSFIVAHELAHLLHRHIVPAGWPPAVVMEQERIANATARAWGFTPPS